MQLQNYILSLHFFVSSILSLSGQNCLFFNDFAKDSPDINPEWIKKNNVSKVIIRDYYRPFFNELSFVQSLSYDTLGYLINKISSESYPQDNFIPSKDNFSTYTYYNNIIQDSFFFQLENIIRNFDQNGRLEKPDTIKGGGLMYNIYNLKYRVNEGEIITTFLYNDNGDLIKMKDNNGWKREVNLEYKDSSITINKKYNTEKWLPFPKEEEVIVKLNNQGLISEVFNANGSKPKHKFYYDDKGAMIKEEFFFGETLESISSYQYIY